MKFKLHVWRQKDANSAGKIVVYRVDNIDADMSFLEMLDTLNEQLIAEQQQPVAFEHDCREGICGACSLVINGVAHGPNRGVTTCQLAMRNFRDGSDIYIEPWRAAKAFPVIKDLIVDRQAFDRIIEAGGFVSCPSGGAVDANAILIPKEQAELAMDAAQCIGCGACAAACKNSSAMLFVAAKVGQLSLLPQGQIEANTRVKKMVAEMDRQGFGSCSNQEECQAVCPKEISVNFIAKLNRQYLKAMVSD